MTTPTSARFLEGVRNDLRLAARALRRSPGWTALAVVTIALGVGVNAAVFSVLEAVVLRPLPFDRADQLVDLTEYKPNAVDTTGVPYPDYLIWKQQSHAFEQTAAYFLIRAANDIVLGDRSSVERVRYSVVTNSFFSILGVHPALGRGFGADDEVAGSPKVFLVSDAVWRAFIHGDRQAIGKTFVLDGDSYTLLGVMPPGFDFPKGAGAWMPVSTLGKRGQQDRESHSFHVLGRLRTGVTVAESERDVAAVQQRLAAAYPTTDAGWQVRSMRLLDAIVGPVKRPLVLLMGAAGFILLIACANLVNLVLVRAVGREREFAIRSALGAGRERLLRQTLAEGVVLAGFGVLLAAGLAKVALSLIVSGTGVTLPRFDAFELRPGVLAFIALLGALAAILAGSTPAWRRVRTRVLHTGRTPDTSAGRVRRVLVVAQVTLALALTCGAGLMVRSFAQLTRVDPGFHHDHLLTFRVALPGATYATGAQTRAFIDRALATMPTIPGVTGVAATTTLPLTGETDWNRFQIGEHPDPAWSQTFSADARAVSIGYFDMLGIPVREGRGFTPADANTRGAIVVNETMARRFWPGGNAVGQRITFADDTAHPRRVVGVVGDVKMFGLGSAAVPETYEPYNASWYMYFVLRTNRDAVSTARAARAQIAALDQGVAVYNVATMDDVLQRSLGPQRFDTVLLSLFGALALALAAVGLYGVLAFAVDQRTHEIGVRVAVGAKGSDIVRLVGGQAMTLVATGIVLGIGLSALLTRSLAALLYNVAPTDPTTFVAVSLLLVLVGCAACWMPARRAVSVDPLVALRAE